MKRLLTLSILALLLAAPSILMARQKRESGFFPYPLQVDTLKNGMQVVGVPFDSPGIVAYYTLVLVGARNEIEPGHSGFAHFFEHMMFRGTKRYPSKSYSRILNRYGANTNAHTTPDYTCYTIITDKRALPKIVELEADRFQNLAYSMEAFQTESKAVLGEYNKNYSRPILKMYEVLSQEAFQKHTYRHTVMGFKKDIEAMPRYYNYSRLFYKRYYRPDNTIIIVVGDFDRARLLKELNRHYGKWTGKAFKPHIPVEPRQMRPIQKHITWKNKTLPRMLLGYKQPAFGANFRESAALSLLAELLFGKSSPLYQELVVSKQRLMRLEAWDWQHRDPWLFVISAILKKPGFKIVLNRLERALKEAASSGVNIKRLRDVKSRYRYNLLMALNTPGKIARALSRMTAMTGKVDALDNFYKALSKVTNEDIKKVAAAYLTASRRTVVTLGYQGKKGGK